MVERGIPRTNSPTCQPRRIRLRARSAARHARANGSNSSCRRIRPLRRRRDMSCGHHSLTFDNLTFADTQTLLATEDRGDTLHAQLNTLDSVWAFDIRGNAVPVRRVIALGLDPAATSEDNEPTGLHVSDGDTSPERLVGKPGAPNAARWFFTEQYGQNQTFEIVATDK